MLSSEYGWDDETILSLTMRKVEWRVRKIIERKNLNMKFEALLHDKEVKETERKEVVQEELDEDKKELLDAALNAAKARKQKEWQAKTK